MLVERTAAGGRETPIDQGISPENGTDQVDGLHQALLAIEKDGQSEKVRIPANLNQVVLPIFDVAISCDGGCRSAQGLQQIVVQHAIPENRDVVVGRIPEWHILKGIKFDTERIRDSSIAQAATIRAQLVGVIVLENEHHAVRAVLVRTAKIHVEKEFEGMVEVHGVRKKGGTGLPGLIRGEADAISPLQGRIPVQCLTPKFLRHCQEECGAQEEKREREAFLLMEHPGRYRKENSCKNNNKYLPGTSFLPGKCAS